MATPQPGVWGIDLGQCALKAIRLEHSDGQVVATAFDYVEHPKILSQPDADPDQLTREALEKFLSRNTLRGDSVAISIPGQSGLARFVKLPPVEEKKINDIVQFEAKQQIPFNLDEVVWDFQKVGSGIVTDGFAMETEIGLFAIKRDTVYRFLQHFKDVNVEVHIIQMSPLALCNFVAYDLLGQGAATDGEEAAVKKDSVVALDIGADNSNLVITDGGRIIWQRPIPLGGNHFTRALTKDLKLTFAKAEHLKRNATKSPDLKKILSALKPVLNDFVGEVQRSLGYFTNTHRDAQIHYMVGLGSAFRLPGLQKFLSEKLSLDVRRLGKLERLNGDSVLTAPVFSENLLSFAVAYGLALQGLKVTHLHTNLLPDDIRTERLIRAKKPWAVTAAAALLLGTSAVALGYSLQYRAVAAESVQAAIKSSEDVVKKAANFKSQADAELAKIEEHKQAVSSIVAGQPERLNWINVMKFVDEALPKSDGSNLSPVAKKKFWDDSPKGQEAHRLLLHRQGGKIRAGEARPDDEAGVDDLININIESMFCMYSPDLSTYNTKLTQAKLDTESMQEKDRKNPPKGKGWVIELRGYTYHWNSREFIIRALFHNLIRMANRAPKDIVNTPYPIARIDQPVDPPPKKPDAAATAETPMKTDAAPATDTPMKPDAAPAADAVPATDAAATDPAATDPAADAPPEEDKPEDTKDPMARRVSHIVLYRYFRDPNPDPVQYKLINSSVLPTFLGAGAAAGGYGAPMTPVMGSDPMGSDVSGGMPGGTPISAALSSWAPLSATTGGAYGMMGGAGGITDDVMQTRGMPFSMPMQHTHGVMPGGRNMGVGAVSTSDLMPGQPVPMMAMGAKKHVRTEFIILFIWNEPTPSDKLMSGPDETMMMDPYVSDPDAMSSMGDM